MATYVTCGMSLPANVASMDEMVGESARAQAWLAGAVESFRMDADVIYNCGMGARRSAVILLGLLAVVLVSVARSQQSGATSRAVPTPAPTSSPAPGTQNSGAASPAEAPASTAGRILLLPRRVVSGERATLAVLDSEGRLTPGVTVNFSNGDHFTTNASGRALFVAALNPGELFATIAGRAGKVMTTIVSPTDPTVTPVELKSAPRIASLSDRFDIIGSGFCGDADTNTLNIGGQAGIVLAASPTALVLMPPPDLDPGVATVQISCGKNVFPPFTMVLLGLELHADTSPLAAGEHRRLTVTVTGTKGKVALEARNLAPKTAELIGGDTLRRLSSGGADNTARFEVVGRHHGNFLVSIRLVPSIATPPVSEATPPAPKPASATPTR
jgi:hypothetical protein